MSRKYKFLDPDEMHFVTYTLINWIDLFIRNEYKQIMLDSWKYCIEHKGMELYSWVIMTSHINMIIGSHGVLLQKIMQEMKKHTSKKLKEAIMSNPRESRKDWMLEMMKHAGLKKSNCNDFQLWQHESHPVELPSLFMAHQKMEYIHNNPVVSGFVEKPEDYLYSSARDYAGKKGLIEIVKLEPLILE
jgi:REP-associated tyrosine transposase